MQDAERLAEEALVDLADEFGTKIYQLAFRYLRNKEDAEEVTQDVLFKVYRKVDAFRGDAALSSWIYRITFTAAMSRLRTRSEQRGCGRGDSGRSVQGVSQGRRVPRRCGPLVLDLPNHVQRGDVAPSHQI